MGGFRGEDGTARIWEAAKGQEIARMTHKSGVNSVAFSPDGRWIISGWCELLVVYYNCLQGAARVWFWRPEDQVEAACQPLPRNMTLTEWQQYFGSETLYHVTCDPENYPNVTTPEDARAFLDSQ